MNPAFSVVAFTVLIGAAQGLVVVLALASLAGVAMTKGFIGAALLIAEAMLIGGLGASFAHLGRPERAWRAVLMWRTSWLSREVIVLPAFMGVVALWWWAGEASPWLLPLAALALAALLWVCTAMIYACIRFIQEWAQPLTMVNFLLIGLASGLVLVSALASLGAQAALLRFTGPAALLFTLAAGATRWMALRHNAAIQPRSTVQSATGLPAAKIVQVSMGMTAGSFNTREFFHGMTLAALKRMKFTFMLLGFLLPALLLVWGIGSGAKSAWWLAVVAQAPGLLAERWFFFADARHPQNLYYQLI